MRLARCARSSRFFGKRSPAMATRKPLFVVLSGLLLAIISISFPASSALSEPRYQKEFRQWGFFGRAGTVCGDKQMVSLSFNFVSSGELKRIFQNYPKTAEKWGGEGAGIFNDMVMDLGVKSACLKAYEIMLSLRLQ